MTEKNQIKIFHVPHINILNLFEKIKIKYMHNWNILTNNHINKSTFDSPERELATIPPRRGKRQKERSSFPFLDDSHRRRRGLIVQQSHRSGEISPFAEERKETERDDTVFLGGGEQQIERKSLAVASNTPTDRNRCRFSPQRGEKQRERKERKEKTRRKRRRPLLQPLALRHLAKKKRRFPCLIKQHLFTFFFHLSFILIAISLKHLT